MNPENLTTEKQPNTDPLQKYNIKFPGNSVHEISGIPVKLKGYSKFKFFAHKSDSWSIREFYTGMRLGSDTTQAKAKIRAKEYLEKNINGDHEKLKEKISLSEHINHD